MLRFRFSSALIAVLALLAVTPINAQTTVTIGDGSSSSSTRGPLQRSDTASSTVYSRFVQVYTASELAAAGIPAGAAITSVNWELASSNVIIGSGDATLKVYIKNSSATEATAGDWADIIADADLVSDNVFNTSNNFPGANGWMPFVFNEQFIYNGGALEISVDWDCSQVSTPAFSGDGALKWRWASTAPDNLVVKKTSSSSPSSNISDVKNERANIQIVYNESACPAPDDFSSTNASSTSIDIDWSDVLTASSYSYTVVLQGTGSGATPEAQGSVGVSSVSLSGLSPATAYDIYVQSNCGVSETSDLSDPFTFTTFSNDDITATIGLGTSSSSTRGPFQRSDTASSTVFSRFVHIYTQAELSAAGIESGSVISALNWELASSNVIIGAGDATLKVYVKNSSATQAEAGDWSDLIDGSDLVVDNAYNTSNNFPGENGWMPFSFSSPFLYTGGALEIAVDWDCSQVSTPAFSGDGSLKWRWESTAPDNFVVKKTSSSSPSSNISDLKNERANIQIVYGVPAPECANPYPQVDFASLSASVLPNGKLEFSWEPIEGQIGCQINIVVGEGPQQASIIVGGPNASSFTAPAGQLVPFTTYNYRVRCGCSQSPLIAGAYTSFSSVFYIPPSSLIENGSGYDVKSSRMVDMDGQWETSSMMNEFDDQIFEMESTASKLSAYPNPANDEVNLSFSANHSGEASIQVFDYQGKVVQNKIVPFNKGMNQFGLNLKDLHSGFYLISLSIEGNQEVVRILRQ